MGILDLFKRSAPETRSSGSGYTAQIMAARSAYIAGQSGLGEATGTVQACVSLWEQGLALAHVEGTDLLTRANMALMARSAALRGEAVFLIRGNRLVPCSDWDLSTRDGIPRAYRVSIAEAGGGSTETALAAEVIHLRIGSDTVAPWTGSAPLRRASLTAGMLHQIENALAEVYENAPLGSQVVPFPESPEVDLDQIGAGFRGRRGRVMLRESVSVTAAGGPAPSMDWRPADVSPDMRGMEPNVLWSSAKASICSAFGVLPGLFIGEAQGPLVREAQRHLAQWTLQPLAMLLAEECTAKLGASVMIDVMRPLQAFDSGNRARSAATVIEAMAVAKAAGLDAAEVDKALALVNWGRDDGAA